MRADAKYNNTHNAESLLKLTTSIQEPGAAPPAFAVALHRMTRTEVSIGMWERGWSLIVVRLAVSGLRNAIPPVGASHRINF